MPGFASVDYNPAAVAASLQSGLFPLQSPLLRESLLVSFPPLSYMLKFSGSSCVTETQKRESGTRLKKSQAPDGVVPPERGRRNLSTASPCRKRQISVLGWVLGANESLIPRLGQTEMKRSGATRAALSATTVVREHYRRDADSTATRVARTTRWGDGCDKHSVTHAPRHIPEAQDAFKGLMIHWILQFALRIAFRCVLHRCGSQDIRR